MNFTRITIATMKIAMNVFIGKPLRLLIARVAACGVFLFILIALFFGSYLRTHHAYLVDWIPYAAGLVFIVFLVSLLYIVTSRKSDLAASTFATAAILLAGASLAVFICEALIVAPIERVHFLKYGSMAFFVFFSLEVALMQKALFAWTTTSVVGILEETTQWFLPERVFDPRDIRLNIAGAFFGTLLALYSYQATKPRSPD